MKTSYNGFTVLELLVVMAILGCMVGIALPNFSSLRNQMSLSDDAHTIALKLGELRTEAIRRKTDVRISFLSSGMSWDYFDDGSIDGTLSFSTGISWASGIPANIVFNGLGLARSIATTQSLSLKSGGRSLTVQVNKNGFISL